MTPTSGRDRTPADARPPFRDNPRLILAGIAVLVAALVAILALANRSGGLTPDYLAEFVLYALIAADLTMVVALVFVLARNIVKLVVERRRGGPFARFRAKLVALLIGMTLVPAMLVLAVGSELIRTSVGRWFNEPMDQILASANDVAADFYRERQLLVAEHAERVARLLDTATFTTDGLENLRDRVTPEVSADRVQMVQIYGLANGTDGAPVPLLQVGATAPPRYRREAADALAAQVLGGADATRSVESFGPDGDLLHAAAVVRDPDQRPIGIVVATGHLEGSIAARSRRMTQAFENYNQLRIFSRPLTGVYLLFFLMVTLMILVGATWMGLYLAKRITRPVQLLANAAREIGAGHLDQRIEPQSDDEFGALTEAFNAMAGELAASRLEVERTTQALEQRRRYVETILERITTGVVSIDAAGRVATINSAAARFLGMPRTVIGQPASEVFDRPDLEAFAAWLRPGAGRPAALEREVTIAREGHEAHLTVVATPLAGDAGASDGQILVLDDVTPLIRAQKVAAWREVARRLAHEIKNPLTPIQLSAERLKRHFGDAPSGARALVEECTGTIIGEVESLKGLVDEFSQFARMPTPRTSPTDLHGLIDGTLALYDGIFPEVTFERAYGAGVPLVRLDPEQIRRVVINVVDNAVEAMERKGRIVIETALDGSNQLVRIVIADNGPGIPPGEREKLFLPYYSTKRRGSGLGLAIVRRIIAEHGGTIDASDNEPTGTRFTIELPS